MNGWLLALLIAAGWITLALLIARKVYPPHKRHLRPDIETDDA
jgi:hypothetical protein